MWHHPQSKRSKYRRVAHCWRIIYHHTVSCTQICAWLYIFEIVSYGGGVGATTTTITISNIFSAMQIWIQFVRVFVVHLCSRWWWANWPTGWDGWGNSWEATYIRKTHTSRHAHTRMSSTKYVNNSRHCCGCTAYLLMHQRVPPPVAKTEPWSRNTGECSNKRVPRPQCNYSMMMRRK